MFSDVTCPASLWLVSFVKVAAANVCYLYVHGGMLVGNVQMEALCGGQ